jgi:small-conductance mechanosensitive channel
MKRRLPILLLFILILSAALYIQNIVTLKNAIIQLKDFAETFFPKLLIFGIFILIAQIIIEITAPIIERNTRFEFLGDRELFVSFYSYVLYFCALIAGAFLVSRNIAAIITSLGLVGLGLAYALQQPIQNVAGWLTVIFTKPFRTRDRISVGNFYGDVDNISMMYTRLREYGATGDSPSGRIVMMPNSKVLSEPVINFTYDVPYVWDEITVPMTFDSNVKKASHLLEKAALEAVGHAHRDAYEAFYPIVAGTPTASFLSEKPLIFFEFGQSSINFKVRYLVGVRRRLSTRTELTRIILEKAKQRDVKIAIPQMKVFVERR